MRIDKEKLRELASLDDTALWEQIKSIGRMHGFKLPDAPPAGGELARVRDCLTDSDRINISGALKIIDKYRKGEK